MISDDLKYRLDAVMRLTAVVDHMPDLVTNGLHRFDAVFSLAPFVVSLKISVVHDDLKSA
jgi:hypothetical protein